MVRMSLHGLLDISLRHMVDPPDRDARLITTPCKKTNNFEQFHAYNIIKNQMVAILLLRDYANFFRGLLG